MKLNIEQIRRITQGAERIEEIDGVIRFFRFTAEERAIYSPTEHFDQITGATAGIQMVFQTDATALVLKVQTSKATNRSFFCHDIFVNDRAVIVSGKHLVPHDTENLADRWVHPNDNGFCYYHQNLQKQLSKVEF